MAIFGGRLRPSYRSRLRMRGQPTNSPASSKYCRRRWGEPTTERILFGYVLSLSLMVFLANVPIGGGFLGGGEDVLFSVYAPYPNEPLPVITMHDLPEKRSQTPVETRTTPALTSRPKIIDVERGESRAEEPEMNRVQSLRPAALAGAAVLPSEEETRRLLRFVGGPPAVDVPPKVRVGSMIVRYPISALRKAIEGLVIVRFTVEPSGRASAIEIVKGLDPACDDEVIEAVERARFLPGKRSGKEVPAYSQMTIRFVLADLQSDNIL